MKRLYDTEDMTTALEEAIDHINSAMTELDGMTEYQDEIDELVSTRDRLEQLLEEANEILAKQQEEEQRELEREYDRMRL
jgi:soluble cytochrome b562